MKLLASGAVSCCNILQTFQGHKLQAKFPKTYTKN